VILHRLRYRHDGPVRPVGVEQIQKWEIPLHVEFVGPEELTTLGEVCWRPQSYFPVEKTTTKMIIPTRSSQRMMTMIAWNAPFLDGGTTSWVLVRGLL